MKTLITFLLLIVMAPGLYSQVNVGKKDIIKFDERYSGKILTGELILELSEIKKTGNEGRLIHLIVYFAAYPEHEQISKLMNIGAVLHEESWVDAVYDHPYGFMIVSIPAYNFEKLLKIDFVKKVNTASLKLYPDNASARKAIHADVANEKGYSGAGIKIGILDTGLDDIPDNEDLPDTFEKADYSLYPEEIDDDVENPISGHGTHVTGSALGRGTLSQFNPINGGGAFSGIAPEADLAFIKLSPDHSTAATAAAIIGGINRLVDFYNVDVISMSFGGWFGHHDGSSAIDQAVDDAYASGVPIFISAGNKAEEKRHASGTLNPLASSGFIQINVLNAVFASTRLYINTVWNSAGEDNDLDITYYDASFHEVGDVIYLDETESTRGFKSMYSLLGDYVPQGNSTYYVKIKNNSLDTVNYHLYEIWNDGKVTFENPDPKYTINTPGTADKAFTVGAYYSRNSWKSAMDTDESKPYSIGGIASYSSLGPSVSGVQKPDIVAPGGMIISIRDRDAFSNLNVNWVDNDGNNGGDANYYVSEGTSMATPMVAGAAALILSRMPNASPGEIYEALRQTAVEDNFTDAVPNNTVGAGKLDIENAIKYENLPRFIELKNIQTGVCISEDQEFAVAYDVNQAFNGDNIFKVELSDKYGEFNDPQVIGELESRFGGSINVSFNDSIEDGYEYRARIVSTSPVLVSNNNGEDIAITKNPEAEIFGETVVCRSAISTFKTINTPSIESSWSVTGGSIIGATGKDSVDVEWGDSKNAKLKLVRTNIISGCSDSVSINITINESPEVIVTGTANVCSEKEYVYTTELDEYDFTWSVSNGDIVAGIGNQIVVTWDKNETEGIVKLKKFKDGMLCSDSTEYKVNIYPKPSPMIMGSAKAFANVPVKYDIKKNLAVIPSVSVVNGTITDSSDVSITVVWDQVQQGKIKLVELQPESGCTDSLIFIVEVFMDKYPEINIGENVCADETVTYDILYGELFDLETEVFGGELIDFESNSLTVKWGGSGNGGIRLNYINEVVNIEDSIVYFVEILPKTKIDFSSVDMLCEGDESLLLQVAEPAGGQYSGEYVNNGYFEPEKSGVYTVYYSYQNEHSCISLDSINIAVNSTPEKPNIEYNSAEHALQSSYNGTSQWFFEGDEIEEETSAFLVPQEDGFYSVIAISNDGCISDTSDMYFYENTSVETMLGDKFSFYPNPASDKILIIAEGLSQIEMYDLLGITQNIEVNFIQTGAEVKPLGTSNGIYIIKITASSGTFFGKVIINN